MASATKVAALPDVDAALAGRVLDPFLQVADLWAAHLEDLGLERRYMAAPEVVGFAAGYATVLFAGAFAAGAPRSADRRNLAWRVTVNVGPTSRCCQVEIEGSEHGQVAYDLLELLSSAAEQVDQADVVLLDAQVGRVVATVAAGFAWTDPVTGATADPEVTSTIVRSDSVTCVVRAAVVGPNQMGGEFSRIVRLPFAGRPLVSHAGAAVRPMQTGFGGRYLRHTLGVYRDWGIAKVHVAAGSFGSYVWATVGFEPDQPARLADRLAAKVADGPDWFDDPDGLLSHVADVGAGTPGALAALASFGKDTSSSDPHDGKRLLLHVPWNGILEL